MRLELMVDVAVLLLAGALASGGLIYAFGRSGRTRSATRPGANP